MDAPHAHTGAATGPADDLIGKLIDGKYLVEKLIGQGGMGKVYRGRNVRTESPVAIKTLIPDLVRDDSLIKRFEIEAKSASNLRHPNTIRIYDFGKEGDVLFMVMELLDGQSLEGLLRRDRQIEPRRLLRILRQTCESLEEAHGTGLVHRDLKPDNIFLNRVGDHAEGEFVKVLDFGVAKLRDKKYGNATLTQAGMIFGTPRYMSPEQARAQDIDQRSDIYALGVIMYECLVGEVPFDANDAVAILVQHVQEPPPPFAQKNPAMAPVPELEAMVMRCLRKKPEERYHDVRELIGEIDRIEQNIVAGRTASMVQPGRGATVSLHEDQPQPTGPGGGGGLRTDGFNQLGLGTSPDRDPTYALGNATLDGTDQLRARQRSPLPLVIGGVVVVLLGAAAVILALIAGSRPQPAEAEAIAATTPLPEAAPTEPVPAAINVAPQLAVASDRLAAASAAATDVASRSVVHIELSAGDVAGATAVPVDAPDATPIALPHRFTLVQAPDAAPRTVAWRVSADGFNPETIEVPVASTTEPVVVRLRRPSSGGSGTPSGTDGSPTRPGGRRPGTGLDDPYANP
jgi:serine/threonine-protein kinase